MVDKEKEQTTLRIPAELREKLLEECAKAGMSLNAYILLIISDYLKNRK